MSGKPITMALLRVLGTPLSGPILAAERGELVMYVWDKDESLVEVARGATLAAVLEDYHKREEKA